MFYLGDYSNVWFSGFSHRKYIEHINVIIVKYLESILPAVPLCCILFLKPAGKNIEDLNENR